MKISEKLKVVLATIAIVAAGVGGVAISSGDAYAADAVGKFCKASDGKYTTKGDAACATGSTEEHYICSGGTAAPTAGTDGKLSCATGTLTRSGGYTCPNGQIKYGDNYTTACNGTNGVNTSQETDLMKILNTIINVVIGLVGFVAVVMIIVGGIQYTTSSGDTSKTTKAKNTIMYGVVGLVIALLAFAIVNFILANVFNAPASS